MPDFLCECENEDCREEFSMQTRDYMRNVKHGQYVVLIGHESEGDEIVGVVAPNVLVIKPAHANA